jgi:hypothetical protein
VKVAAKNAADTIQQSGTDKFTTVDDMSSLANDVLKQAEASLAAFIGAVNYSDQFNVAAAIQSQDLPEFDDQPAAKARCVCVCVCVCVCMCVYVCVWYYLSYFLSFSRTKTHTQTQN